MTSARGSFDDAHRQAALRAWHVMGSRPAAFEALAEAAAAACDVPVAWIRLVDPDRQRPETGFGPPARRAPRRVVGFGPDAKRADAPFEACDAAPDRRVADDAFVVDEVPVRFHAGAALVLANGARVGTLCLVDRAPRALTDVQRAVLLDLAAIVAHALEGRCAMQRIEELANELVEKQAHLRVTLRSMDEAVIAADGDGRVSWLNPVAERLTGWCSGDARGRDLAEIFRIVAASTRAPIDCVVGGGRGPDGRDEPSETLLIGRFGTEVVIEKSISATRTGDGVRQSVVIVFRAVGEPLAPPRAAAQRAVPASSSGRIADGIGRAGVVARSRPPQRAAPLDEARAAPRDDAIPSARARPRRRTLAGAAAPADVARTRSATASDA